MNQPANTTQPEPVDLKKLLAARIHIPDVGLEHVGDRVSFDNTECAVVTVNDRRLKLLITCSTVFELKEIT